MVLYVASTTQDAIAVVPYRPEMQLYDYLRRVLAPRFALHIAHNGESVLDTFYVACPGGGRLVFNRENRLLRLGEVVLQGATVHHIALGSASEALMRGNATHGDVTDPCPICFEDGTDLELPKCHHRMHSICLGKCLMMTAVCPLCRAHITA